MSRPAATPAVSEFYKLVAASAALIGATPLLGYHLTNVALHAASACLLVLIVGGGRCGMRVCPAPGVRGGGGLEFGAEEYAFRFVLALNE